MPLVTFFLGAGSNSFNLNGKVEVQACQRVIAIDVHVFVANFSYGAFWIQPGSTKP